MKMSTANSIAAMATQVAILRVYAVNLESLLCQKDVAWGKGLQGLHSMHKPQADGL